MLTDGRKLFRTLREMTQGDVPAHLVEAVLLGIVESSCPLCQKVLASRREAAKEERLLRPLMAAWHPHLEGASLEQAHRRYRDLLRAGPWQVRLERVENARTGYGTPALVALLLEGLQDHLRTDPVEARRFAQLAEIASFRGSAALTPGCRALATAYLANAHRVCGDLREAAAHFSRLRELSPPPSAWIRAEIASLQGSLLKDLRRFKEALERLERAARAFAEAGDLAAVVRVELNLGTVEKHRGNLEEAIRWTSTALRRPAVHRDPRLYLWASHNLVVYYRDLGDHRQARSLFDLLAPLYDWLGDENLGLRRRWVAALLSQDEADPGAEQALRQVVEDLTAADLPFEAALARMDLALLLFDQARNTEVSPLVAQLVVFFNSQGVSDEAMAALLLLLKTVSEGTVTRRHLLDARRSLEQIRAVRKPSPTGHSTA